MSHLLDPLGLQLPLLDTLRQESVPQCSRHPTYMALLGTAHDTPLPSWIALWCLQMVIDCGATTLSLPLAMALLGITLVKTPCHRHF